MKFKKKIFTAGIALAFCLASTSIVYAGTGETNTNAGADLEIVNDHAGGTESLTISMSPGVLIIAETMANDFALATTNANANADTRLEYGIWSQFSGYYQQKNETSGTMDTDDMAYDGVAGDPSSTTSPFGSAWTSIGGGGT